MELSVTLTYRAFPEPNIPGHSYIEVRNSLQPNSATVYEGVPNVLVNEVMHELEESNKCAIRSVIESMLSKGAGK